MEYSTYIRRCATRRVKKEFVHSIWEQYDRVDKLLSEHMDWLFKQLREAKR